MSFAVLFAVLAAAPAPPADLAPLHRYALIVGDDSGDVDDETLRYAQRDAERVAAILREVGGVSPEDLLLLTNVGAPQMRRALIDLNARIRQDPAPSMLFVFYSGHGDAEALHLRRTHLDVPELRGLVSGSPAGARVLVVDSCRSGALTRVKGGRPAPSFAVHLDDALAAQGTAILTSSAANEDSQESDQLQGSFFTHFFDSGLIGAADANGDGIVSLAEAFDYAAERTLAATERTLAGPQHPTFRFDLGGRGSLPLTEPGHALDRLGALALPAGAFLILIGGPDGPPIAEVRADKPRTLALAPGDYFVEWRRPGELIQGRFNVHVGETTEVEPSLMAHVAYAQVVRKGGSDRHAALSAFLLGGARGDIFGLGVSPDVVGGLRLDLSQLSLELRLGYGNAFAQAPRFGIRTQEFDAGAAALRAFDVGPVTLGIGLLVSNVVLTQTFHDPQTPNRASDGLSLGPIGSLQLPLYHALYARLDVAVLTYLLQQGDYQSGFATPFTGQVDLGLGWFF